MEIKLSREEIEQLIKNYVLSIYGTMEEGHWECYDNPDGYIATYKDELMMNKED